MSALFILACVLLVFVVIMLAIWLAGAQRRGDTQEQRRLYALLWVLAALVIIGFSGCSTNRPKLPEQVTVTVERYKPLPAWATDPLPKPQPVDGTVGARNRSHEARGGVIDVANCDRRLLKMLDAGEAIDPKACGHE